MRFLARPLVAALGTALALSGGALVALTGPAEEAVAKPTMTRVVGNLNIAWDLTWVQGTMLFDQRAGGIWSKRGSAPAQRLTLNGGPNVLAIGESGMLGMVADPAAATNRRFYTCSGALDARNRRNVEVWSWTLSADARSATAAANPIVRGIPMVQGRHSGCRLVFRSARALYIGTGDAAQGSYAQNLQSLGGKVLRVRSDGYIYPSNPFYKKGGNARYVWSYGHRNVQGLAMRPGHNQLWSAEHGPTKDDEVNLEGKGKNYGWRSDGSYSERQSMTDRKRYPKAVKAKWRSGRPTVAPSGITFLSGKQWGTWNGRLMVAHLKGTGVQMFSVSSKNKLKSRGILWKGLGRVRAVVQGPDGALYITTSNNDGKDGIYRFTL